MIPWISSSTWWNKGDVANFTSALNSREEKKASKHQHIFPIVSKLHFTTFIFKYFKQTYKHDLSMQVHSTFFKYWYWWHLALCTAKQRERRPDLLKPQAVLFHSKPNPSPATTYHTPGPLSFPISKSSFPGGFGLFGFWVCWVFGFFCGYRQTNRRVYLRKVSSTRVEVSSITTSLLSN